MKRWLWYKYASTIHVTHFNSICNVQSTIMLLCILTIFLSASVFLSGRSFTVFSFEFDVEFDTNADNCGDKPFIDKFMDISGAEYFRLTDSKLMVNGTLKVLQTYSKDKPIIVKQNTSSCDIIKLPLNKF